MLANETKVASDGYEVCLFPCETMYLNVNRTEHDVYALDFLPVTSGGVPTTEMPVYAPFTGAIVYTGNDHNCILESNNLVHTPSGLKYVRVLVAHSNDSPPVVTSEFRQGLLYYKTGDYGYSFGEHLHLEYALVDDKSSRYWNTGGIGLYGGVHMWEALYIDDTNIFKDGGYSWVEWGDTPTTTTKKKKFPWVLYARKLRDGRS